MGNMSGYGVKLMLPSLLSGLDEKQWRTKKGSIELLGMMAYCSPRQLSLSLPIVIPRLTGVLTDSHAQVRTAANKSLKQFGEVISNPEIQSLVPVLLKALVDPNKTPNALASLLKTSFMHYIDHSSLALVRSGNYLSFLETQRLMTGYTYRRTRTARARCRHQEESCSNCRQSSVTHRFQGLRPLLIGFATYGPYCSS
jgi:hypothetical protein